MKEPLEEAAPDAEFDADAEPQTLGDGDCEGVCVAVLQTVVDADCVSDGVKEADTQAVALKDALGEDAAELDGECVADAQEEEEGVADGEGEDAGLDEAEREGELVADEQRVGVAESDAVAHAVVDVV